MSWVPPPAAACAASRLLRRCAAFVPTMHCSVDHTTCRYAREHQPCIIFMDEIDAIGGKRFSEGTSADREVGRK